MRDSGNIPVESQQISRRFFEAIESLTENNTIRGIRTVARKWGVDRSVLSVMKNHPERKRIKVEYIYFLSRDYDVSPDWIIRGEGEMWL